MRIRSKMMLYILATVFIGMSLSGYLIYLNVHKSTSESIDESVQISASAAAIVLKHVVLSVTTSINVMADSPTVRSALLTADNEKNRKITYDYFMRSRQNFLSATDIFLLDKDGIGIVSSQPLDIGADYSDMQYYKEISGGQLNSYGLYSSRATGEDVFIVAARVLLDDGFSGVLVSTIGLSNLADITLDDIAVPMDGELFITNSDGKVLFSIIDNPPEYIGDKSLWESINANKSDTGKVEVNINGNTMSGLFKYLPTEDWYSFAMVPDKRITDQETLLRTKTMVISATFVFFIGFVLFLLLQGLVLAIQKSISFALAVSEGDLSNPLEIDRKDELGDAAVALNMMVQNLKASMEKVQLAKDEVTLYKDNLELMVQMRTEDLESLKNAYERESSLMRTVINTIPDLLFYKDLEGRYQGCNISFAKFADRGEEEIIGKTDRELFGYGDEMVAIFLENDRRAVSSGIPRVNMEWVKYPDGTDVCFETVKTRYGTESAGAIGLLGISRDMTARIKTEKELEKARTDALEASHAKSEFLARMSHEIRTPLNGIIGMDYLALQANPPEEIRHFLKMIEKSANNLLSLINDILDFSKIEAGKMEMENAPFSLKELLENINELMKQKTDAADLILEVETGEKLPNIIIGDSMRLNQVLLNLVSNAVKFTKYGKVSLAINIEDEDDEKYNLHFAVKDTGIGISSEQLAKLFVAFTQADGSTTRKYGGTGLGLSISKLLVELMNGKIWAESTVNVGSIFHFTVPFKKINNNDNISQDAAIINKESITSKLPMLAGKKVLLVEDNAINREIAKLMLSGLKIEVDLAVDGLEAVDFASSNRYDLVLMDIQMPNMDGYEATKRIREAGDKTPIVAMTANAMNTDRDLCLAAGMDDHLPKPFNVDNFHSVLVKWIFKADI